MNVFSIGRRRYRIVVAGEGEAWTATAEVDGAGTRFGGGWTGCSEGEAIARAVRWIAWQHDHGAALEALQAAERAYHRAVADMAFTGHVGERAAGERQRATLDGVEAARLCLDRIRARMPEGS